MIIDSTTYASNICLPIGIPSGNSSIFTKTGNMISVQGFSDYACLIAAAGATIPLNNCIIQYGSAAIFHAYAPNTIPPDPFTSTTGQVTETSA
jgi:hypothetical protein